MASIYAAAASYFTGGAGGGGGGGTTDIFTPQGGNASATNQGITFGNTATQSLANNLPLIIGGIAAVLIGFALIRRR